MSEQAQTVVSDLFFRDARQPSMLVADGYGLDLHVHHGQLVVRDGIGRHRRERRLTRAQRTVSRIVLLGHTGSVTLDAVRWCANTNICLVQLDPDGPVLLTSGPGGKNDARLRRAQAAAANSHVGLSITRALLGAKFDGQAANARQLLANDEAADAITRLADQLRAADSLAQCRDLEAQASNVYFGAWAGTARCRFAERDQSKVPPQWAQFTVRRSPLGRGATPRNAADPINALCNYGYALAEAECRLALQIVGLDPGMGIVHTDVKARDSLALDLLEPLRPLVERRVLQLLQRRHFRWSDLHETRQGGCRLLAPLTHDLAEAIPSYAAAVAPLAEHVAHAVAATSPGKITLSTPLTRANVAAAQTRGRRSQNKRPAASSVGRATCRVCGVELYGSARKLCPTCWPVARAQIGRQALAAMRPNPKPTLAKPTVEQLFGGLTFEQYQTEVLPALATVPLADIERATGLSNGNCSRIRRGLQVPNPHHWAALAALGKGRRPPGAHQSPRTPLPTESSTAAPNLRLMNAHRPTAAGEGE